ncbi:hypothetical protein DCAR_0727172 [Daucus carota subsp. sativus]|uniref:Uncharacterized protein n=1 Tax=Daucus carota subsp. sativus TaxID=79200 RepID=A0A161X2G1_DAUCS|nr:hypothetical protein DCAR_0727172 [Daucus carota subsp. sativus]
MEDSNGKLKINEDSDDNEDSDCDSISFDEPGVLHKVNTFKGEGNVLFQKRDHESALLKYEEAINWLPKDHNDVPYIRSNMAACYMQMGLVEYPKAINECNLALEVAPTYSKALLKRARCLAALNRVESARRDVEMILKSEPNNMSALEILEDLKRAERKSSSVEDNDISLPPVDYVEPALIRILKERVKKRRYGHVENKEELKVKKKAEEGKKKDRGGENKETISRKNDYFLRKEENGEDKSGDDKVVVKDKCSVSEDVITKTVKLVLDDDIRFAQLPQNCSIRLVRNIVQDRFPNLMGALIKFRDPEGDLITITTTEELRVAEKCGGPLGSVRLYIVEVSPEKEPLYDGKALNMISEADDSDVCKAKAMGNGPCCVEEWIVQFARLFKNHVGFDSDSYLDLHELGVKLYTEAMEETVTSEDAQDIFEMAVEKFQEMTALALFNWGNVHLNRARRLVCIGEDISSETILALVKSGYEWADKEYTMAGIRYADSLRFKPDFYEGHFALGQQLFEQAKLCWYYAIGNKIDLDTWPSTKVLDLYNKAEENMDFGMQLWEELEEELLNEGLQNSEKRKADLRKMGLDRLYKDISVDEAEERAGSMGSQIYLLWGTILYERSIVEFKLDLPTWEECLEVAVEKFELSGASTADIAVMTKNHISNGESMDGFGFKIDEIIQAWNDMYDAKRWESDVSAFRLEPLFRRRVPKLHSVIEHVSLYCS